MSEIVQPRRSSRVQAKLADQEKRKAEEKDNPDFENTVIKVAKKVAKKSVKKKSENVKKTTNNIEEDSKKSAPKKSKNNSKKVTKTVESVELESVPKEPKDWGISSDEEANNGDEVEAEHAASDEEEVVLPAVFRVNTEEVAKETPETDPTETNAKKSTAKKSTKTKKSKTKEPELTAAELQEMIMIKQTVLNLVTPIAVKNNCLASLEAVNKPKFEIPKLTKLGIANVKGYSTYEPHKNPWVQNGGMMNQYGGYDRDPFMSSGGFNDYGGGETGPDQPHPSIVQAVQANDLENVRRLIKHALSLPEASSVVKHKIPKQRGLSAEKQKEVNKWKAQNKLLKKQNEENVVTFKKFTSKEQALNIARFVTEEEEKHHYTKSWEWYEDTALHAAVRQGRDKIVKILLEAGADPTLKACVGDSDDQNYPIDLVQKLKSKGYSVRCYNNIEMMLTVALEFWDEASYSGISAGCSGTSRSWSNANQCKDLEGLQKQLSVVTEFCDWELLEDDR